MTSAWRRFRAETALSLRPPNWDILLLVKGSRGYVVTSPSIEALNEAAAAQIAKGEYQSALAALQMAVQTNPLFLPARNNLGVIQYLLGQLEEAAESFSEVIASNPLNPQAYRNLARCVADTGAHDEAILLYRRSLSLDSQAIDVQAELGSEYAKGGYQQQSEAIFATLCEVLPSNFLPWYCAASASLPRVFTDQEHIAVTQTRCRDFLEQAEKYLVTSSADGIGEALLAIGLLAPTHLQYLPGNQSTLAARFGQLMTRVMAAKYPQFSKPMSATNVSKRPVKVGIVYGGSASSPVRALFDRLPTDRFIIHRYTSIGEPFDRLCSRIAGDALDILVHLDLKENATAWQLAALRLAPVQCATWTHDVSTGLPTIDYFLSSEAFETDDSDGCYTEKLLRLPNLGAWYEPKTVPREAAPAQEDRIRFLCGQPTESYLPEQDDVFVSIAQRVPNAQFVFPLWETAPAETLKARLHARFEAAGLQSDKFISIAPPTVPTQFDAFIDGIGFNHFNISMEIIQSAIPIIAWQGGDMRTRCTAGILQQIGVTTTIAGSFEQMITIAAELAGNPEQREAISKQLKDCAHRAYKDQSAVSGLATVLRQLVS